MFALLSLDEPLSISLKCEPEKAIDLRERYNSVIPGYHFNKKHWNTIYINGLLEDVLIREWIDHSWELVVQKLPKADKARLLS